ncbi:hypothetical protein HMPREF9629_01271 [Peptoanaerobacter stomatis]|uniref:SseB protein C-terminal domain-containing protein n=2 Tax=Peptoanaerobacter stomatis TaxID=796937 RepID=G9WYM0_9FIRM|nr:hypothetical protein HMPREF9629_01271 [Peptoanaerobacter stomatis]
MSILYERIILTTMIRKKDLSENFSNEALEYAIKNVVSENSQDNQNTLISELLNTYLYTLVDIPEQAEDKVQGFTLLKKIENKETFLPVFTNMQEMKSAKGKYDFEEILLDFDEISGVILDKTTVFKGFIINGDSDNIIITDELINYILENRSKAQSDGTVNIEEGETVEISSLEGDLYPKDMIDALVNHFKSQKNINSAYIRFLSHNGDNSYLLITDFTGDKDTTFAKISEIARPFLTNMYLDQLEYSTKFGKEATKDIAPFYKKKILGIF